LKVRGTVGLPPEPPRAGRALTFATSNSLYCP